MTAQERLDYLLETVSTPTNALITIGTIRDSAGLTPQQYGLVRSTLDSVIATLKASSDPVQKIQGLDLQDALSAMLAGGILLSGPDRQAVLDQLAVFGSWPDAVRDAVKGLGVVTQPRWQSLGLSEPTLESVQAEIDAEQAQLAREAIEPVWTAKQAVVKEGIFNGTITTLEQIVAAIGGE